GGPNNPDVAPGTTVTLVNQGEPGPLQLVLGPGTYSITNAATSGPFSAWSFLIARDNGNGTATILKSDYMSLVAATQALAAGATGSTSFAFDKPLSAT